MQRPSLYENFPAQRVYNKKRYDIHARGPLNPKSKLYRPLLPSREPKTPKPYTRPGHRCGFPDALASLDFFGVYSLQHRLGRLSFQAFMLKVHLKLPKPAFLYGASKFYFRVNDRNLQKGWFW